MIEKKPSTAASVLRVSRNKTETRNRAENIQEIRESTVTSSSEYRLLVAEFGLLDAQLANLTKLVAELTGEETGDGMDGVVIDEDELEVGSKRTTASYSSSLFFSIRAAQFSLAGVVYY